MTFIVLLICFSGCNLINPEHKWINDFPKQGIDGLIHQTYYSNIHKTSIGYIIALPENYDKDKDRKYPVVYCLHGGNPGNECQIDWYNTLVKPIINNSQNPEIIYVWNNGGKHKSHYDFPQFNSYAETTFIEELIPHIDSIYRTIPNRMARGLQGYSMGGRAAARYIFKYPELFSVSISIAGGHQFEKENSDTKGDNNEYQPTDNSWDLAKIYSDNPIPPIKLFVYVGSKDRNYEANIEWSKYLNELGIKHSIKVIEGIEHHQLKKLFDSLGKETQHNIFYQNFEDAMVSN